MEALEPRRMLTAIVPAHLDSGFGGNGVARVPSGSDSPSSQLDAGALAAGPGDTIYVSGFNDYGNIALSRIHADGSVDTSFGTEGIASCDVSSIAYWTEGDGILVQPDGKVIVVSRMNNTWSPPIGQDPIYYVLLARFNPDGTIDSTFGNDGVVAIPYAHHWVSYGTGAYQGVQWANLWLADEGKVVVVNQVSVGVAQLLRLNSDGSPDASFGPAGARTISVDVGPGQSQYGPGIISGPTPDGRIVVYALTTGELGNVGPYPTTRYTISARGELTSTQPVTVPAPSATSGTGAAIVLPDGGVLLFGYFADDGSRLIRLAPDGLIDPSFSFAPPADEPIPISGGFGLLPAPEGTIYINEIVGDDTNVLRRLKANGSPDTTFASGGLMISPGSTYVGLPRDDGSIVLGVSAQDGSHGYFELARLLSDGQAGTLPSSSRTDAMLSPSAIFIMPAPQTSAWDTSQSTSPSVLGTGATGLLNPFSRKRVWDSGAEASE